MWLDNFNYYEICIVKQKNIIKRKIDYNYRKIIKDNRMSISFDDISNKSENIIKNITKDLKKDVLKKSFFGNIVSNVIKNIDEEKEDKEFVVKLYMTGYIIVFIILGIVFSSFSLFLIFLLGIPILFLSKILALFALVVDL